MAIIRFIDDQGQTRIGTERDDGRADLLSGDLEAGYSPTGESAAVTRLLAPVVPSNIFAIGINYRGHCAETGRDLPERPVIFMKPTTAVIGPGAPIRIPACQIKGPEVDYEAELIAVIGKTARDVSVERALDHVFGFTCGNDVSARRWQKHAGGGQFIRGKGFDTFAPLGPRLVTREEIGDVQSLPVRCWVNGELLQDGSTDDMVFSVAELIAFMSQDTTLLPGTIIFTGTPAGVGFVRQPMVFLNPGDEVTVEVGGIGKLTNPVAAAE